MELFLNFLLKSVAGNERGTIHNQHELRKAGATINFDLLTISSSSFQLLFQSVETSDNDQDLLDPARTTGFERVGA